MLRRFSLFLLVPLAGCATRATLSPPPDLATRAARGTVAAVGRTAVPLVDGDRRGLRLDERSGHEGLVWLDSLPATPAVVEVELRGKDVMQRSFVGLAFAGANDSTYEAVYLRPFNFRAADSTRRARAVQYVAHPGFTWERLRQERPGDFEDAVDPAADPDGWHRLRLTIGADSVRATLDGTPVLAVPRLRRQAGGRVGLFVGAGSGGDFAGFRASTDGGA